MPYSFRTFDRALRALSFDAIARTTRRTRRQLPPQRRKPLFEALEARLLLSADLLSLASDQVFTDGGPIYFNPVEPGLALIRSTGLAGEITGEDPSDDFFVTLDPGHQLTVTLVPDAGFFP